ncbi:unnamed protein product [Cunninghamella echinulata]
MGKLNRQEFDFYANLYLSRQNAHLHNAFILSTIHNAQSETPPPSRQRTVGWKRKRGKDGQDHDPRKQKLKMDIMSLSKQDRERLKALIKNGDKEKLRPLVNKLLEPRISKPIALPSNTSMEYSRGLLSPLCSDLRELPRSSTLQSRMSSIAIENGLSGGVSDDAVYALLFAMESYIKSTLSSVICKCRYNKSVGLRMIQKENINPITRTSSSLSLTPMATHNQNKHTNNCNNQSMNDSTQKTSIGLRDLAFSFRLSPYITVENLLNTERLTALITENDDTVTDDELDDSSSENEFII